jgi:hypothetical protein
VVTAKEKLRDIFASGLIGLGGIAFSSEKAREAKRATHGIDAVESMVGPTPPIYSGRGLALRAESRSEAHRTRRRGLPLPEHDGFHAA